MAKSGKGANVPVGAARTRYISVPAAVAGDSAYPFEDGEQVIVTIEGRGLSVRKLADGDN